MSHHHHHHSASSKNLGITIILNIFITVAQVIGGLISGSMALISDATHNFSDVISLVISWVANKQASKQATGKQTFGRKRSEIMAAFVNSATLIILSVFILFEALQRILLQHVIKADWVIWLAVLSIVINALSVLFIKKDAKDNLNIKSAYLHLFSDMLTSVAVLVGGLAMKYLQWYWVDPVFSIGIAFYLLYSSWYIFKSSTKILMQYTPEGLDISVVVKELEKIEGIKNFHHVHIWQLNESDIMFESHVDVTNDMTVSEFEKLKTLIDTKLAQFGIQHVTLQPEYETEDDKQIIKGSNDTTSRV